MANTNCSHTNKYFRVSIFIHVIVRLCHASLLCQETPSKFLVEPTDKQAVRGENVVFQCSVADFNPLTKSLRWRVFPDPNATPTIHDIYDPVNRNLISNITIQNYSKHIQLYISCILEEITQQKTCFFSSNEAMLDTIYFPTQNELSCNPPFLSEVNIGGALTLTCSVPRSNPPVDMSWKVVPGQQMLLPLLHDDGSVRLLTHDLLITQDLHLKTILCEVSSEFSFPGEKLQCSIGPIKVRHPPEIHIYPQITSIMLHEQSELTCTADAYPQVENFTWTCFPEGILKGCGSTSSSRQSFALNPKKMCTSKVEGVHITCSTINSEGRGSGYAYFDIAEGNVHICQNNGTISHEKGNLPSKEDISVNTSLHVYHTSVNGDFAFICVISDLPTGNSVHFQWYIDDVLLTNDSKFMVKILPLMSTLSLFRSFERSEFAKTLSCEATIDGMRARAFTNLSSVWKNKCRTCLASTEYSWATSQSNCGNLSVNKQLTEHATDTMQSFLDNQDSNRYILKPFMMMIISGAVLLIAIIMIITSLYLCRANRKTEKETDSSSDPQTSKSTTLHAIPEYCTNIDMVDDTLYEEPIAHSQQTSDVSAINFSPSSTEDISGTFNQNLHHDYYIGDSQDIYSVNSSDPQSDHYEDSSLQYNYTPATHDAFYENRERIKIHSAHEKPTKISLSNIDRQQIMEQREEYPMPEFPKIQGN